MKIRFYQEFLYNGSVNELMDNIKTISRNSENSKAFGFYTNIKNKNEFQITALSSLGTMLVFYAISPTKGISAYCSIEKMDENHTKVEIKTKIRFEIYFFIVFVTAVYIGMLNSSQAIPFWVYFFPALIIPWFHLVYRYQENGIIEKLINGLDLKKIEKTCYNTGS